ncbi:MAG: hypothetical protein ACYSSI_12920, partial [Planctomycetota bacterium]
MATKTRQNNIIDREKFAEIEKIFRKHFQLGIETTNTRGQKIKLLCSRDCEPKFCRLVRGSMAGL